MVLVGTHSKRIEADLFDCFLYEGWVLDVERPAVLGIGRHLKTLVDSVQLWRNPRLRPDRELPLYEEDDYAGSLTIDSSVDRVKAGEEFWVEVTVTNLSSKNWKRFEEMAIRFSYHWIGDGGKVVVRDGARSCIEANLVEPNSSVKQKVRVVARLSGGQFVLRVSMVQESVCWFEDKGFSCGDVSVVVE